MTEKEPCPSCDRDLWHPGHVCYTYAEWRANIAAAALTDPLGGNAA